MARTLRVIFDRLSDRQLGLALVSMLRMDWQTTEQVCDYLPAYIDKPVLDRAKYHGFCTTAFYAQYPERSRRPRLCWQLTESGRGMAEIMKSLLERV